VWSRADDGSGRAFKVVWRPVNNGTCHAVETLVESRKVVHEETTTTMVGTNAMAVALMTKRQNQGSRPPEIHCGARNQEKGI
jgi:hypothetical protein